MLAHMPDEGQGIGVGLGRGNCSSLMWGKAVTPHPARTCAQPCFAPEPDLLQEMAREAKSPKPFLQKTGNLLH
jgi:hypothetical protein